MATDEECRLTVKPTASLSVLSLAQQAVKGSTSLINLLQPPSHHDKNPEILEILHEAATSFKSTLIWPRTLRCRFSSQLQSIPAEVGGYLVTRPAEPLLLPKEEITQQVWPTCTGNIPDLLTQCGSSSHK